MTAALRRAPWTALTRSLWTETAVAGVLLVAVGFVAFGSHVRDGGFYNDDWSFVTITHYWSTSFVEAISNMTFQWFRPVVLVYWPLTHTVFGDNVSLHLAWAALLGVLVSLAFFVFLRTLGLAFVHAAVIAALVLVFPASDSTRLWATGSIALLASLFALLGAIVAVRGLAASGRRAVIMHAAAVALYALSVMTYEVAPPAILAMGAVYWLRAGRRAALPRWIADVATVATILVFVTSHSWNEPQPIQNQLDHARLIADQGLWLIAGALDPFTGVDRSLAIALLAAVAVVCVIVWRLLPPGDADGRNLGRWLAASAAGAAGTALGFAMYVAPDPALYQPLGPGQHNRMNVLAALGIVVLVYSLVMVGATVAFRGLARSELWATGLALVIAAVIGAGYVHDLRQDAARWDEAARIQRAVLASVRSAVPQPPSGATIYVYGYAIEAAPGVPSFSAPWDLDGAVKHAWDDPSLRAHPAVPGTWLECGDSGLTAHNWLSAWSAIPRSGYGEVYFVDAGRGRAVRVADRAACQRVDADLARFAPPTAKTVVD
jgi:hypothetical protein